MQTFAEEDSTAAKRLKSTVLCNVVQGSLLQGIYVDILFSIV